MQLVVPAACLSRRGKNAACAASSHGEVVETPPLLSFPPAHARSLLSCTASWEPCWAAQIVHCRYVGVVWVGAGGAQERYA